VKRTRWEYHVLMSDLVDEAAIADAFTDVRRLGEDGWELVSVNYLTAYAPSLEPARADEDVLAKVRKRFNGTFGKMGYAPTATQVRASGNGNGNGSGAVEAPAAPPRIDALPETRLEAWFKRPALPEG
jgi:hypothetical protein